MLLDHPLHLRRRCYCDHESEIAFRLHFAQPKHNGTGQYFIKLEANAGHPRFDARFLLDETSSRTRMLSKHHVLVGPQITQCFLLSLQNRKLTPVIEVSSDPRNVLQHDGTEDIVLGEHKGPNMNINSARNFTGPVINWFTCNNGYHAIHHMYSNMHWTQYPEMHAKVIAPHNDPSLDEPDILRFLWRTYFWPGTLPAHRQEKAE